LVKKKARRRDRSISAFQAVGWRKEHQREVAMRSGHRHLHYRHSLHYHSLRSLLLSGAVMLAAPVVAAEVTPQRLANPEPQN